MKTSFLIKAFAACLFSIVMSSFCIYATDDTHKNDDVQIKVGETDITVTVDSSFLSVVNNPRISVITSPIYCGYQDFVETPLTQSAQNPNIFTGKVPTQTSVAYSGLKVSNGFSYGMYGIILNQDLHLNINLKSIPNPKGGAPETIWSGDSHDDTFDSLSASRWFVATDTIREKVPKALYADWRNVRKFEKEVMWESILKDGGTIKDMDPWVLNSLKVHFSAFYPLHYAKRAKQWCDITVDDPPLEYYRFLNEIDYSPLLLRQMPYCNSLGDFLYSILIIPAIGINEIGEQPIEEWKSDTEKKLSAVIDNPTSLLLNLLSGASYIKQLNRDNKPLTPRQIENIKNGYTNDLGKIILAANDELVANSNKQLYDDHTGETIDLEEYINERFPGRPVVVDHWETWCGPCQLAISEINTQGYHEKYPEVVFLYVCSESSDEKLLQQRIPKISGEHLKLNKENARVIRYEKGPFDGIPAYTFYDKDHKAVDHMTGFPGVDQYEDLLKKITEDDVKIEVIEAIKIDE